MSSPAANRGAVDNSGAFQPAAQRPSKEGHRAILQAKEYTWGTWCDEMPGGPPELADAWATALVPLHLRWDMLPYTWEEHCDFYGDMAAERWEQAEGLLFLRPWLLQELHGISDSSLRVTASERLFTHAEWTDASFANRQPIGLSCPASATDFNVWEFAYVALRFCQDNVPYTWEEIYGFYGSFASTVWGSADGLMYLPALCVPPLLERQKWSGKVPLPDGATQPVVSAAAASPSGPAASAGGQAAGGQATSDVTVQDMWYDDDDDHQNTENGANSYSSYQRFERSPCQPLPAATSGATQPAPGDSDELPLPHLWQCFADSPARAPLASFHHATSVARSLLVWANSAPMHLFPLLVHDLCDVAALLRELDVGTIVSSIPGNEVDAVSLEAIPRVPNQNSIEGPRIDYFLYTTNGDIIRCHPGHRHRDDAKPHVMRKNTTLLQRALLPEVGAGKALHLMPPGLVAELDANRCAPQPPGQSYVFSQRHASCVYAYDAKSYGWDAARRFLQSVEFPGAGWIDLTDGQHWPWWLFLANTGKIQQVFAGGILSFEVVQLPLIRAFRIGTGVETFFAFSSMGVDRKLTIRTADEMRTHRLL